MIVSFPKISLMFAVLIAFAASSAFADGARFDRDGHGYGRGYHRGSGFDRDDRGFGPGWVPGYGPGFFPGPAYVFTCFAIGNGGTWFYATGFDPNYTQQQAFAYCASTGQYCQATGCR